MKNTYTKTEKYMYITGVFGQSMIYELITTGYSYFLQSVIFIPAMAISVIFSVSRIWDAVKNPIMGSIVDRTKTKWGKCRPYLLFSPVIVCLTTILCFINSIYSSENSAAINIMIIVWTAFSYLLWGMIFTVTDVPLWGMISLMTDDEKDRSSILVSARNFANIGCGIVSFAVVYIAQFVGGLLSPKVESNTVGLKYGVFIVALVITVVGSVMYQMAGIFAKERISVPNAEKKSIKQSLAMMWKCLPVRQLLISGILRSPTYTMRKIQVTLITYYYGDNGQTPYIHYFLLLGGGYMVGQFISIAVTPKLAQKLPKEKAFAYSNIGSVFAYLLLYVVYAMAPSTLHKFPWLIFVFLIFTAIGLGAGFINAIQSLMIADSVDYEEYNTGYRPDGVFYSLPSFISNFSSGIGSMITGAVFAFVGFSGDGVKAVNDALYMGGSFKSDVAFAPYRSSMFVLCSFFPAIGLLASVIPMRKYALPDKKYKTIAAELKQKREQYQN